MAIRLTVVYEGGETETIPLRPLGLVAAERHFGGDGMAKHGIEASLWAAWYLKGKPTGNFDGWLGSVEDVSEEEVPTRPLDEGPSPEPSPTSRSPRASAPKT